MTGPAPGRAHVDVDPALRAFADEVGAEGAVHCIGGRTQWTLGGSPAPGAREVRAPAGIVEHQPEEMTVRVRAATPVAELAAALAGAGQRVILPEPGPGATVGGVLAVGQSGIDRLGVGPVRDAVLQVRYVSAAGEVVTAGGATVKNVSGFDLCRLLVGSLGTVGLLAEVVLRTRPRPEVTRWLAGAADPFVVRARLPRPSAVLWDGEAWCWVLIEGRGVDVDAQAAEAARLGLAEVDGPPPLPAHRWSMPPGRLRERPWPGAGVAEIGVGIVHCATAPPPAPPAPEVVALNRAVRARFDPSGRLNPGRDPLGLAS